MREMLDDLPHSPIQHSLAEFDRAEQFGYVLVSEKYLSKLEGVAETAREAFFNPDLDWALEDALRDLGTL